MDYHLRQILNDYLDPKERAPVSVAFRRVKDGMTTEHLGSVNDLLGTVGTTISLPATIGTGVSLLTQWRALPWAALSAVPVAILTSAVLAALAAAAAATEPPSRIRVGELTRRQS